MYRVSLAGAAALALLSSAPAYAHHPSGVSSTGGAGAINTISATTLDQGQGAAAIFIEIVKMNPFSDAELTAPGTHHPHSLDAILAPSLSYAYGVTKDLTVSFRRPTCSAPTSARATSTAACRWSRISAIRTASAT